MKTNFHNLWFDPIGNRAQVYRFSSRHPLDHWLVNFLAFWVILSTTFFFLFRSCFFLKNIKKVLVKCLHVYFLAILWFAFKKRTEKSKKRITAVAEWMKCLLLKLDLGSITGQAKPKTIKIGIRSFPACWLGLGLRSGLIVVLAIGVARGNLGVLGPPNWNATNDKNVTKKTIVSSVSVSFSIFAYSNN